METSQTISPQIGGLVTTLQKSFLQDTSPPPSICSSFSMDYSIDRLNNSLITSADFSNVTAFFQTSTTQEDLENTFLEANYSISDLIRDRKTLDNLTMSGDSTIIKDSNIAQIDDVSLMSSSTINNSSTDSLSGSADLPLNNTVVLNATFEARNCDATFTNGKKIDVTYDAIENTSINMVNRTEVLYRGNATFVEPNVENDTFTKPASLNETFDKLCGTPETSFHIEQSTPHHTKFAPGKKFTPSFRGMIADEVNLSPITCGKNQPEVFADGTYEENILKASCEGSNEDDFYDMLDKFGRYTPSAEKAKIQKSVDSIKKKYVQPSTNGEENSSPASSFVVKESGEGSCSSSMTSSGNVCNKLTSSSTSLTTSTDRLLNRRGRLYDDIHMNISQKSLSLKESITTSNGGEKDENTAATNSESLEGGLDQIEEATPAESERRKTDIVNKKSGKIRDHDRFKTIKISKRSDDVSEQQLNVPCIDNEFDQEPAIEEPTDNDVNQRFSRKDSHFNSPSNFLTYKKPKEKAIEREPATVVEPVQSNARSLSRPRYISGLQKLSFNNKEIMSKAASADDLEKSSTTSSTTDLTEEAKAQPVSRFGLKKFSVGAQSRQSEVKSPMGNKAKSLHNLSNNFGFVAKKPGLRAPSVPVTTVKSRPVSAYIQKAQEPVFKVPQANAPVALRKTSTTATAPAAKKGMMRPSSGYYGSSSSAASTKSTDSLNSLNETTVQQPSKPKSMGLPQPKTMGIPKPSGLRPPSALVKKSGLPRPASIVRR
ncbi:hypothetical protein ACFFRR_010273 [Megaselia abdita]